MRLASGLSAALLSAVMAGAVHVGAAQAQLVDNPQNLMKAWSEAYASRNGEPMARVYARDAHLWGDSAKEPSIGIDNIKQYYERTGRNLAERSASITKMQMLPRKRATIVSGTLELKSKLKDGTVRNQPARFTMSIVRESRRQWAIVSHHISAMPN